MEIRRYFPFGNGSRSVSMSIYCWILGVYHCIPSNGLKWLFYYQFLVVKMPRWIVGNTMEYITILYKMVGFLTPNPQCCLPSYDTLFIIKRGRLENSKLAMFDYRGGYYPIFHEDPQIFQHLPLICRCIPSTFYQYSSNCISFTCPHPVQYPLKIPFIPLSIPVLLYPIPVIFQYIQFLLVLPIFHWYSIDLPKNHYSTTIFVGFSMFFPLLVAHVINLSSPGGPPQLRPCAGKSQGQEQRHDQQPDGGKKTVSSDGFGDSRWCRTLMGMS